jgi:hypothetical protein
MIANISFEVFDCNGVAVRNAQIKVNGKLTAYSSNTGLHTLAGQAPDVLDIEVTAPGFKPVQKKGIPLAQRPHEIYLGKEGDPWYIDVNGMPVAYSYRPRDILVVLHATAAQPMESNHKLLSLPGLEGFKIIEVNWHK